MRVAGSDWPDSACSWLPSSTAPRESRPASISGASGSTSALVVCLTASMMKSMLTAFFSPAACVMAPPPTFLYEAKPVMSEGTSGMTLRNLDHLSTTVPKMAGPRGAREAANATVPSLRVTRPMPPACKRMLIVGSAAMPTSAHGPHWTEEAVSPRLRRQAASASSVLFAADVDQRGSAGVLQGKGAQRLGRVHALDRLIRLAAEKAVIENAGRMPDAGEAGGTGSGDATHHAPHCRELCAIAHDDADHAAGQLLQFCALNRAHLATPGRQHDGLRAILAKPFTGEKA
eukprot:scaffold36275_cov154-Isochrysis_galbana.AAC.23